MARILRLVQLAFWEGIERLQIEVTFARITRHFGIETQRQWFDKLVLVRESITGFLVVAGVTARIVRQKKTFERSTNSSDQ